MPHPRLSLALDGSDAIAPRGRVLVLGPGPEVDLDPLPRDRSLIVQAMRPAHDIWVARGWQVCPDPAEAGADFAATVVFVPRARAAARELVAEAARRTRPGGAIWIDGRKTDGIEAIWKDVRARTATSLPIAKAHGRIFRIDAAPVFDDWRAADMTPAPGFVTRPGMFSADRVDHGSALLEAALPTHLPARIADLGAGWGWLSAAILRRAGVEAIDLVEADHLALCCARRNISDPRARFHWEDATRFRPESPIGAVVMNPPFHTGRAAEPALGAAFIAAAAAMLAPSGRLWMVANRHLPYEAILTQYFRNHAEIGGDSGFKVIEAARPVPVPRSKG